MGVIFWIFAVVWFQSLFTHGLSAWDKGTSVSVMPELQKSQFCFSTNTAVLQQKDSTWSTGVCLRFYFGSAFLFGVGIWYLELDAVLGTFCKSFNAFVALCELFVFIVLLL